MKKPISCTNNQKNIEAVLTSTYATGLKIYSTYATGLKLPSTYATGFKTASTASGLKPLAHNLTGDPNESKVHFGINCWMDINPGQVFDDLYNLDKNYQSVREKFQNSVGMDELDRTMLDTILAFQGKAYRAIHNFGGMGNSIPAGLNLGGYSLMRLPGSLMFFHRMKLRNFTRFKIDLLSNDLKNMVLTVRLSLNDLHLRGSYERAITDTHDPSILYYKPTAGTIDLLLRNGKYKVEGRYIMLQERLMVQHIISDITMDDVVATYSNDKSRTMPIKFDQRLMGEFLQRMKLDLDLWLKDYFNDYLALFKIKGGTSKADVQKYDKKKAFTVNKFVENTIDKIKYRLRQLRAISLRAHEFTIHSNKDTSIALKNGVIRGLESLTRRSIGTTVQKGGIRYIDCIVSFSKLKIEYQYEAQMTLNTPVLTGNIVMVADGLAARMQLAIVREPEAFDLHFNFFEQTKPESLVIEGPLNRRISNFKHIIENQVLSLLYNSLMHQLKKLDYLSHCTREIPGHVDPDEIFEEPEVTQKYDRVAHNPYSYDDDDDNSIEDTTDDDNKNSKDDTTDDPHNNDDENNSMDHTTACPHNSDDDKDKNYDDKNNHDKNYDEKIDDEKNDHEKNDHDIKDHVKNDHENNDHDKNDHDENDHGNDDKAKKGEWGIDRSESVEFVLPHQKNAAGEIKDKKMHLKYKEYALLSEVQRRKNNNK